MYANIDNPPGTMIQTLVPRLDPDSHMNRVSRLSELLVLISRVRTKALCRMKSYQEHSLQSSPFVSRESLVEDFRKWSYIAWRLERYYLKKVCELNSVTYKAIISE